MKQNDVENIKLPPVSHCEVQLHIFQGFILSIGSKVNLI